MRSSNKGNKPRQRSATSRASLSRFELVTDEGSLGQDETEVPTMADMADEEVSPESMIEDLIEDTYPGEEPMAKISTSSRPKPSGGAHVNGLFALLSKLEGISGSKSIRIKPHPSGHPIGTISVENGVITDARQMNSTSSIARILEKRYPEISAKIKQAGELARATQRPEINVLTNLKLIPEKELKSAHRSLITGEILKMAASGTGWNAVLELTGSESAANVGFGLTPLQLMLEGIAHDVPKLKEDVAWKFFDSWATKADGALLLFRPNNRSYLPVPSRIEGLDGTKLSELRAICRSAGEMCQPLKFVEAGEPPVLTTFTSEGASWICGVGPTHYVLLRLSQRSQVAMAISSIIRSMKEVDVEQ